MLRNLFERTYTRLPIQGHEGVCDLKDISSHWNHRSYPGVVSFRAGLFCQLYSVLSFGQPVPLLQDRLPMLSESSRMSLSSLKPLTLNFLLIEPCFRLLLKCTL